MKNFLVLLIVVVGGLIGCNKSAGPVAASGSDRSSQHSTDAVQQKLQEYSGAAATDCGPRRDYRRDK